MTQQIVTVRGDMSRAFLDKLENAFPLKRAMYREGDTVAECALKAGQQEIIEWIKSHARISSHS